MRHKIDINANQCEKCGMICRENELGHDEDSGLAICDKCSRKKNLGGI